MTSLSAIDFLGLAEQKRVARVDLAEAGFEGIVYVCDLSASKQQEIMSFAKGTRVRAGKDYTEFDTSALGNQGGAKILEACMVTDSEGGAMLERAFDAIDAEEGEDYIVIARSELVWMSEAWRKELGTREKVLAKLGDQPNEVMSLISKVVRNISGLGSEDELEEKKAS